jgi:hypothetical protein
MVASFFIFIVIGLYLDNVFPSIYGLRKHPFYCLTRYYWCKSSKGGKKKTVNEKVGHMTRASLLNLIRLKEFDGDVSSPN